MKRLINKDVPFITYIIHDKNMKNGRTVTVYKPTQEYYILFELIKFRRLPSTFPDIGITVISEGLEPSPSDVSTTQDVLMDIKKDLSDAEIEELGAQEAERKEFCPNCEAETPCTHEAELFVCDICGEDFAKYIVSRNRNVSDVSMTRDVLIDIKTPSSIENTNPDYYKQELASRDALIERLIEAGNVLVDQNDMDNGAVMAAEDEWRFLVTEWKAMKGGE